MRRFLLYTTLLFGLSTSGLTQDSSQADQAQAIKMLIDRVTALEDEVQDLKRQNQQLKTAGVSKAPAAQQTWAPPDLERETASSKSETACALPEVVEGASKRVQALVENMQRFSAKEQAEFEEFDEKGTSRGTKKATFDYVAYIQEVSPQVLNVEEYRNDSVTVQNFPSKLATIGTAAFALIFHPVFLKDFTVTCEGLADWKGRPAWRLYLVQKRSNNFRGYRLANRYFPVMLKARAWIDTQTFEVLRLETSLREPIEEIPLQLEHVSVEYGNVEFPKQELKLWLPQSADIYMDYRGRRYHHRHAFSSFQLFWVDTQQTIKAPKAEGDSGH
jgi:hypothetical protein